MCLEGRSFRVIHEHLTMYIDLYYTESQRVYTDQPCMKHSATALVSESERIYSKLFKVDLDRHLNILKQLHKMVNSFSSKQMKSKTKRHSNAHFNNNIIALAFYRNKSFINMGQSLPLHGPYIPVTTVYPIDERIHSCYAYKKQIPWSYDKREERQHA